MNPNPAYVALGPWGNEVSFWQQLVERKRLPHLAYPGDPLSNRLRDSLAVGEVVFKGLEASPFHVSFPETVLHRVAVWLRGNQRLRRIYFDVTGISGAARVFGIPAKGYFARKELELILADHLLLRKTLFFEEGAPLWRNGASWLQILTGRATKPLRWALWPRRNQVRYVESLLQND